MRLILILKHRYFILMDKKSNAAVIIFPPKDHRVRKFFSVSVQNV